MDAEYCTLIYTGVSECYPVGRLNKGWTNKHSYLHGMTTSEPEGVRIPVSLQLSQINSAPLQLYLSLSNSHSLSLSSYIAVLFPVSLFFSSLNSNPLFSVLSPLSSFQCIMCAMTAIFSVIENNVRTAHAGCLAWGGCWTGKEMLNLPLILNIFGCPWAAGGKVIPFRI